MRNIHMLTCGTHHTRQDVQELAKFVQSIKHWCLNLNVGLKYRPSISKLYNFLHHNVASCSNVTINYTALAIGEVCSADMKAINGCMRQCERILYCTDLNMLLRFELVAIWGLLHHCANRIAPMRRKYYSINDMPLYEIVPALVQSNSIPIATVENIIANFVSLEDLVLNVNSQLFNNLLKRECEHEFIKAFKFAVQMINIMCTYY